MFLAHLYAVCTLLTTACTCTLFAPSWLFAGMGDAVRPRRNQRTAFLASLASLAFLPQGPCAGRLALYRISRIRYPFSLSLYRAHVAAMEARPNSLDRLRRQLL